MTNKTPIFLLLSVLTGTSLEAMHCSYVPRAEVPREFARSRAAALTVDLLCAPCTEPKDAEKCAYELQNRIDFLVRLAENKPKKAQTHGERFLQALPQLISQCESPLATVPMKYAISRGDSSLATLVRCEFSQYLARMREYGKQGIAPYAALLGLVHEIETIIDRQNPIEEEDETALDDLFLDENDPVGKLLPADHREAAIELLRRIHTYCGLGENDVEKAVDARQRLLRVVAKLVQPYDKPLKYVTFRMPEIAFYGPRSLRDPYETTLEDFIDSLIGASNCFPEWQNFLKSIKPVLDIQHLKFYKRIGRRL